MEYAILLLSGVLAGMLASLFGLGGGLTVVPTLLICLPLFHVNPELSMHIAVGTSFGVMLFSNINAARHHHKAKNHNGSVLKKIIPYLILGIGLSIMVASYLSSGVLQSIFIAVILYVIIRYFMKLKSHSACEIDHKQFEMPSSKIFAFLGFFTGLVSGCTGGGTSLFVVPFLKHRHMKMKNSVAVSTVCNIMVACVGFFGSILSGWHESSLPSYSLGYIYIPVLIIILAGTIIGVPIGGRLVGYLKEKTLTYGYLTFLLIIFCVVSFNTISLIN